MSKTKVFLGISYLLISINLILCLYLFHRNLIIITGQQDDLPLLCDLFFGHPCDKILKAQNNYILNLPLPAWGIIYLSAILCLLFLKSFLKELFKNEASIILFLLLLAGSVSAIWLLSNQFIYSKINCNACLFINFSFLLINFFLLKTLFYDNNKMILRLFTSVKNGFKYLLTGYSPKNSNYNWKLLAFLFFTFFCLSIYQKLNLSFQHSSFIGSQVNHTKEFLENFENRPFFNLNLKNTDPKLGSGNAKVQMVIFSDFECPFCAEYSQEVEKWLLKYPNDLQVTFKHYPLSNNCNPGIEDDMHANSCNAALASIAANNQGAFWEYHNLLFNNNLDSINYIDLAQHLNLNTNRFETDFKSKSSYDKLQEDINFGNKIGISGTPSIIINGKLLEDIQPEIVGNLLSYLINQKDF